MTEVMPSDYTSYLKFKGQGKIKTEKRYADFVYYSLEQCICVEQPNGARAMVPVIERYRIRQTEKVSNTQADGKRP